ncbi:hypothetical protein CTTA_4723 [Comamonas testosteroni]|uniref:Uncharacterized protein n=1 Tax=Comamonas testosteroni TaxID=285 RepID=A0A5A7MIQ0_COMTE|nr:hypothetical protein CTTA_4723 [Comamonas testosteroni]
MRCLARQQIDESNRYDFYKSFPRKLVVNVDRLAAARKGIAYGLRTRKMEFCNSRAHSLWRHANTAQETDGQVKLVA